MNNQENTLKEPQFQGNQSEKTGLGEERLRSLIKERAKLSFEEAKDQDEKVNWFVSIVDKLSEGGFLEDDRVVQDLWECRLINNKEEFVSKILNIMQPVFDLCIERGGEIFRALEQQAGKIAVNDFLSYEVLSPDSIAIHLGLMPRVGIIKDFEEGLKDLAEIVKQSPEIKNIYATSWIVFKQPKLIERFGFRVIKELSEDEKKDLPPHQRKQGISESVISREELLERYAVPIEKSS
ncbi:MAG: hypothetical protein NTV62_02235 [Candidatus Gribaldobacteria bacterium]|nr:hypothetical protein [Candidatus Gribaldobacteria bacterium]